jgi:hypothetical protein
MKLKTRELHVDVPLEDGAVFTLRKVSQEVYLSTIYPVLSVVFSNKDRGLTKEEQHEIFNQRLQEIMNSGDGASLMKLQDALCYLFEKMIVSWSGIEDEDGNEFECNQTNIKTVRALNPGTCCDAVTAGLTAIEEKEAELAKN